MQYKYVQTLSLPYGIDGNWTKYTNPKQPIWEFLYSNFFRQIFIQIQPTSGINVEPFWIDAAQLVSIPGAVNLELVDFLTRNFPDNFFVAVENVPTYQISYVKYYDARMINYRILATDSSIRKINPLTLLSDLPDLLLQHPRTVTDLSRIDSRCLIFVNGFLHQTVSSSRSSNEVYIKDAGKTLNISGYDRVGIIDFDEIGTIQKFALSDLTLTPSSSGYYGGVTVSGVPVDLTNSQILLSLGGYLILPSSSEIPGITTTGAHSFNINIPHLDIEQKIVEASNYIDLSNLGLETLLPTEEDTTQSYVALHSDGVIEAFLKLSQSFLIVVPKTDITSYFTTFRRYGDNRSMRMQYEPTQLLYSNTGKLLAYWNSPGKEGDNAFNRVVFTGSMDEDNYGNARSELYSKLLVAYPKLQPIPFDIDNQFYSLGFYTSN